MKFNSNLLGIPEELFQLFENSKTESKVTNSLKIRDYIQSKMIDGKMVVVKKEKFLEEQAPTTSVFGGYALNWIVDLIGSGYEYLGFIGGKHTLLRDSFVLGEDVEIPTGMDREVPESFVYIEVNDSGEVVNFEVNELERMREVVKLPSGEWVVKKEWSMGEVLSLKYKSLTAPKYLTPKQYNALPSITPEKFNDAFDVNMTASNIKSNEENLVRHVFTAIEQTSSDTLKSHIFMNGKTDDEKSFSSYSGSVTGLSNWNSYDCSWALYNDYPVPSVESGIDPDRLQGIGNFGMVKRVYFPKNDPKSKEIKFVGDGQQKYDPTTHTFHYDPSKGVFIEFRTNAFPKNGKEVRFETFYNPISGKTSYSMWNIL